MSVYGHFNEGGFADPAQFRKIVDFYLKGTCIVAGGGVSNPTRALEAKLASSIRVNAVCPGMVDTSRAEGFRSNVGNYPVKRRAGTEKIARAILFLASPDSSYVTGGARVVDGGHFFR